MSPPPVRVWRTPEGQTAARWSLPEHTNLIAAVGRAYEELPGAELHTWVEGSDATSLSLQRGDGTGSVVFEGVALGTAGAHQRVAFFREGDFSSSDVAALVAAYDASIRAAAAGDEGGRIVRDAARVGGDMLSQLFRQGQIGDDDGDGDGSGADAWFGRREGEARSGKGMSRAAAVAKLQSLGVALFTSASPEAEGMTWDCLAGYPHIRQVLESELLLQLKHPEAYAEVAAKTRTRRESNRTAAILFEGPPGTGKTTAAKVLAATAGVPLVHLPAERIASKWYGEEQRNLAAVFDAAEALGGCIIFIDEIESLTPSRGRAHGHEATNKTLSVLLRKLDGFETKGTTTLIAATNRREDVDAAMLSRFAVTVPFALPNAEARAAIWRFYARQLPDVEVDALAQRSDGMSARDIKHVCESAERRFAAAKLRKEVDGDGDTPDADTYLRLLREETAGAKI